MHRQTRQRDAIRAVMEKSDRPLTPEEILDLAARDVDTLSLSTVYRTLKRLTEDGDIKAVDVPGEPARYERAGLDHHHHFLCRSCGRMYDIEGCPGQIDGMAPDGYEVEGHEITLYGRCPRCTRRK